VGISYWGRTYEEGKKIQWKDGVRALWCLVKYCITEPAVAPRATALPVDTTSLTARTTPEDSNALLSTRPNDLEAALWSLREIPAGPDYVAALCVGGGRDWHLKEWPGPAAD
jgi:hypothetical protein